MRWVVAGLAVGAAGCRGEPVPRDPTPAPEPTRPQVQPPTSTRPAPPDAPVPKRALRFPDAPRVVAFGDVHGDLGATRAALRLAGATDDEGRWSGGALVVVQTGDQLDRGDDEQAIIDLFDALDAEARPAGGAVHVLNGNHELMNVAGDLRYVTPGGFADFEDVPGLPPGKQARQSAFSPGGPYAKKLATRNTVVIVGPTVFVHGGVLPAEADGLAELNQEIRAWFWGALPDPRPVMMKVMAPDSVVWTRAYSDRTGPTECAWLDEALAKIDAKRMVVGHTPQPRINAACDGKVWRVDVGMAAHYGGQVQVLEIRGDDVAVLGPP